MANRPAAPFTGNIRAVRLRNGSRIKLNFDDWFYRIDENACIVRGSAGRADIPFATAHVTYRKLP